MDSGDATALAEGIDFFEPFEFLEPIEEDGPQQARLRRS